MSRAKSPSPSGISTQSIVWAAIGWAALALMFYLFFNTPTDSRTILTSTKDECKNLASTFGVLKELSVRPNWYRLGTYIFQTVAIAFSGILCLRNWRSSKIISGRNVWLGLGLGIIAWGIGNLIFGFLDFQSQSKLIEASEPLKEIAKIPEAARKQLLAKAIASVDSIVSPFPSIADIFFTATYVFLSWGMAMSVIGRRLNLYPKQWGIVAAVGFVGVGLAAYVTFGVGDFKLDTGKILNIVYALGDIWLQFHPSKNKNLHGGPKIVMFFDPTDDMTNINQVRIF